MKLAAYLESVDQKPSQFARLCKASPSQISRLLRGERGISLELALVIERISGGAVRPADLALDAEALQKTVDSLTTPAVEPTS